MTTEWQAILVYAMLVGKACCFHLPLQKYVCRYVQMKE